MSFLILSNRLLPWDIASERCFSLRIWGMLANHFGLFFYYLQDEVAAAQPEIDKRTEQLVSKGRWQVPGYKVRYSLFPIHP